MFGDLAVIPDISSPELRDCTTSNTLLSDILTKNHQNYRHRPDHHKNCNKLNHYSVYEKNLVIWKTENYVISDVIIPNIKPLFLLSVQVKVKVRLSTIRI
jgi:hypothetical protein